MPPPLNGARPASVLVNKGKVTSAPVLLAKSLVEAVYERSVGPPVSLRANTTQPVPSLTTVTLSYRL